VRERKPNIKSLARRNDEQGLVDAASYRDVKRTSQGTTTDLGIPVRAEAILALGSLGPDGGGAAVEAALSDPADHVRCAAVRVLHARRRAAVLARALGRLPAGEGDARELVVRALLDLRKEVDASAVVDALVHREDEELLDEADVQLITSLLDEAGAEGKETAIRLLVRALGAEREIVVDRATDLLIRLAPERTDALVDELRAGTLPADAALRPREDRAPPDRRRDRGGPRPPKRPGAD
jgi:hypothetical protein